MDEDVPFQMVQTFVRELQGLVANAQGLVFVENYVGEWTQGIRRG